MNGYYNHMHRLPVIIIRPHWKQYVICQARYIILLLIAAAITPLLPWWAAWVAFVVATLTAMTILYNMICMARIVYYVTDEQIVFRHGLTRHTTEYMELYRVIDYRQTSTPLQQMLNLKTVTIISNEKTGFDRNAPILDIIGVRNDADIITAIRNRVEYNKRIKKVYEISNR